MYAILILGFMVIAVVVIFKLQKGSKQSAAPSKPGPREKSSNPSVPAQSRVDSEEMQSAELLIKISVQGDLDNEPLPSKPEGDRDAWEDWTDEFYDPYRNGRVLKVPLLIEYRDKKGIETRREVLTERYVHDGKDGLIHAFCKLRNGRRPFRLSRIAKAVDVDTGEVIEDLPSWLDSRYESTDEFRLDQFIEQHTPALGLCQAMAKADGAFRAKEKGIVAALCVQLGASESVADLVVKAIQQWEVPSAVRVGRDIRALVQQPEMEQQLVLDSLRQIIASDKTEREDERRLLEKVEKALKAPKSVDKA